MFAFLIIATTSLKNQLQSKHAEQYAMLTAGPSQVTTKIRVLTSTDSKILDVSGMPKKKQLTLKEINEGKLSWDINESRSIKYHYLISEMITVDKNHYHLLNESLKKPYENGNYLVATYFDPGFETRFLGLDQTPDQNKKSFRSSDKELG